MKDRCTFQMLKVFLQTFPPKIIMGFLHRTKGLTGRLCIVAETAHDLQLRDGGLEGSCGQGALEQ